MTRILTFVIVLFTVGCAGSSARPGELSGEIAFVRVDRVVAVDAADSTVTRIGRHSPAGGPSWSPDGTTVAFSTPSGDIELAAASGSERRLLRRPWCFGPVFSPDGSRLVCDVTEPNVITVVDAVDGSIVFETPDCCYQPAWSPDGRQIAFVSYGTYDRKKGRYVGPAGLFVMNADGSGKRRVAKSVSYSDRPAWSSDGTIAFLSDGGIWTVSASGVGLRRLARVGDELAWSPDGGQLAFRGGDGDYEIYVVNADGTGLKNLTDNDRIQDESPAWSPDGKAITFVSNRDERLDQLFAMRADGSGQTQLTDNPSGGVCCPAWDPAR